jgi:hypothetical protein
LTTSTIRIPLSERRPLTVTKADWPLLAKADWFNGEHECQANYVRKIRVRESRDGLRRVVYGSYDRGNGGAPIGFRGAEGGFLLSRAEFEADEMEAETVRAIRRVAGIIGDDQMGDECIANLPAEDATAKPADEMREEYDFQGATRALTPDALARLLALLVRAKPYCPADLQQEIEGALGAEVGIVSATRWVVVAQIPQVDGAIREVRVEQRHASEVREVLRQDPARVERLWCPVQTREAAS